MDRVDKRDQFVGIIESRADPVAGDVLTGFNELIKRIRGETGGRARRTCRHLTRWRHPNKKHREALERSSSGDRGGEKERWETRTRVHHNAEPPISHDI